MYKIFVNKDLFRHLLPYIHNYHALYITSKVIRSHFPPHRKIKYKDLHSCSFNKKTDKYMAITILKKNKNKRCIHFENKNQLKIAEKHLSDIGQIKFYCCNGKGVSFVDQYFYLNRFI